MNRKILFSALIFTLTFIAPIAASAEFSAFAQNAPAAAPAQPGGPVAIGQAMAQVDSQGHVAIVGVPQAPPPDTSFSLGSWIANLLGSLAAIFGSVIAAFVVQWVRAVAARAGVQLSQDESDKLDAIIENGVHAGASKIGADLTGKLTVDVKNQVAIEAVKYAQGHGAETLKALSGFDPADPKAVEALQARAAKLLNTIGPDAVLSPSADKPTATATASVVTDAPAADIPQPKAAPVPEAAPKPQV